VYATALWKYTSHQQSTRIDRIALRATLWPRHFKSHGQPRPPSATLAGGHL